MSILGGLKEALSAAKDAQTVPVLRERLELAEEQLAIAEKKVAELESENASLLRENREQRVECDPLKTKVAECVARESLSEMVSHGPD
jgi:predicted RNase H-like nuclease (RuvC/YqgF family)